jgi:hypothetical protein
LPQLRFFAARQRRNCPSRLSHLANVATITDSEFEKRSQLFIGVLNEPPTVAAIRVRNPDRSPAGIHC